jgi:low temperature requirement protein LtrA
MIKNMADHLGMKSSLAIGAAASTTAAFLIWLLCKNLGDPTTTCGSGVETAFFALMPFSVILNAVVRAAVGETYLAFLLTLAANFVLIYGTGFGAAKASNNSPLVCIASFAILIIVSFTIFVGSPGSVLDVVALALAISIVCLPLGVKLFLDNVK